MRCDELLLRLQDEVVDREAHLLRELPWKGFKCAVDYDLRRLEVSFGSSELLLRIHQFEPNTDDWLDDAKKPDFHGHPFRIAVAVLSGSGDMELGCWDERLNPVHLWTLRLGPRVLYSMEPRDINHRFWIRSRVLTVSLVEGSSPTESEELLCSEEIEDILERAVSRLSTCGF